MVASGGESWQPKESVVFQSPSLRGSGRFLYWLLSYSLETNVSIPFIAGQWSLLRIARRAGESGPGRFNPLHCGAVVASGARRSIRRIPRRVSIPFIAGQWSLLTTIKLASYWDSRFQSPSLRGSGRFGGAGAVRPGARKFQSPSLRGSGRFEPYPGIHVADGVMVFQSPSLRGSGRFPWGTPAVRRG